MKFRLSHLLRSLSKGLFLLRPLFWRAILGARRFRTTATGQAVVHYAPELEGELCLPVILERCQNELDFLAGRFGFTLPSPLNLAVFASLNDVRMLRGAQVGAFALPPANAVGIAAA